MNGYSNAKATADKLRKETEEAQAEKELAKVEALNALDALKGNEALTKLYQESAGVGAENLSGELPQLKIHTANKSQGNELADGSEPNDGWFFLKSEGLQYEEVICHIVHISEGYRAEGMDGKKDVYNQLVSGVLNDNGDFKPFLMYFTGSKLSNLFAFEKAVARYTKGRLRLPLFALTIKLTTEKVEHSYGKSWVAKFDILKDEKGMPLIVADEGLFVFLKDAREQSMEIVSRLISAKLPEEQAEVINASDATEATEVTDEVADGVGTETQEVSPEEIPF